MHSSEPGNSLLFGLEGGNLISENDISLEQQTCGGLPNPSPQYDSSRNLWSSTFSGEFKKISTNVGQAYNDIQTAVILFGLRHSSKNIYGTYSYTEVDMNFIVNLKRKKKILTIFIDGYCIVTINM